MSQNVACSKNHFKCSDGVEKCRSVLRMYMLWYNTAVTSLRQCNDGCLLRGCDLIKICWWCTRCLLKLQLKYNFAYSALANEKTILKMIQYRKNMHIYFFVPKYSCWNDCLYPQTQTYTHTRIYIFRNTLRKAYSIFVGFPLHIAQHV